MISLQKWPSVVTAPTPCQPRGAVWPLCTTHRTTYRLPFPTWQSCLLAYFLLSDSFSISSVERPRKTTRANVEMNGEFCSYGDGGDGLWPHCVPAGTTDKATNRPGFRPILHASGITSWILNVRLRWTRPDGRLKSLDLARAARNVCGMWKAPATANIARNQHYFSVLMKPM